MLVLPWDLVCIYLLLSLYSWILLVMHTNFLLSEMWYTSRILVASFSMLKYVCIFLSLLIWFSTLLVQQYTFHCLNGFRYNRILFFIIFLSSSYWKYSEANPENSLKSHVQKLYLFILKHASLLLFIYLSFLYDVPNPLFIFHLVWFCFVNNIVLLGFSLFGFFVSVLVFPISSGLRILYL